MFIDKPENTIRLGARDDGITDDGTHYLLRMRRDSSMFYLNNRAAMPTAQNIAEVAKHFAEISGVEFSPEQAEAILSLYPQVRIKVANYDGIEDTDVRDGLSFAMAHFFLGCTWPTFGDKVDLELFVALLQKQAGLMGFRCSGATA